MKIKFTEDYRGRETQNLLKKKGETLECGTAFGLELIRLGVGKEIPSQPKPHKHDVKPDEVAQAINPEEPNENPS